MDTTAEESGPPDGPWKSIAFAILLLALVFPDVLLLGASLAPSSAQAYVGDGPTRTVSLYPPATGRLVVHGTADSAAGALQLEPAAAVMARTLRHLDSPWWNPYSAAGSLGPETLVDAKLSPLTLLTALAGGGQVGLHLSLLAALTLALGTLHRALTRELGASQAEAALGCVVYLLNGFATSYVGTQVLHPYLLAPPLLLALLAVTRAPAPLTLGAAALAHAALLMTTFLPVVALVLLAVHTLVAAQRGLGARTMKFQVGAAITGVMLVAWLYLPILESLCTVDLLSRYALRDHHAYEPAHLLSLITSKHFWESGYGLAPEGLRPSLAFVPHSGVVTAVVIAAALRRGAPRPVLVGAGLVVLAGLRMFDAPLVGDLLARAPGISIIRAPYWGAAVGLGLTFAAARSMPSGAASGARRRPVGALVLTGSLAAGVLSMASYVGVPPWPFSMYLVLAFVLACIALALVHAVHRGRPRAVRGSSWALVVIGGVELMFLQNHLRGERRELLTAPPAYVDLVRQLSVGGRVVSIGHFHTLTPEWGAALGVRQADTLNSSTLPWYRAMFTRALGDPGEEVPWLTHGDPSRVAPHGPTLDHLAVRCLVVDLASGDGQAAVEALRGIGCELVYEDRWRAVLRNPSALPRVWAAPALARAAAVPPWRGSAARRVAVTEDPALLEEGRRLGIPAEAPTLAPEDASVEVVRESNAQVVLDVRLPWPGVVVLADTWHPRWRAHAGSEQKLLGRVNEAFRGVPLPAGRHLITLSYRPATLAPGIALSLSALALLVAWGASSRAAARAPSNHVPCAGP